MDREGISEEATFEPRPKWRVGAGYAKAWVRVFQADVAKMQISEGGNKLGLFRGQKSVLLAHNEG